MKTQQQQFLEDVQINYDGDFYQWFKEHEVSNQFFDQFSNDPEFQLDLVHFYKAFCDMENFMVPLKASMNASTQYTINLPIIQQKEN